MPTYTGRTGRGVGVLWGSSWIAIGLAAVTVIADTLQYLPQGVERVVGRFAPWLLTIAGPEQSSLWGAGFFGIFAAVGLVHGTRQFVLALTASDYSITLNPEEI